MVFFSKGTLSEVSGNPGSGKTEVVLKFLAENPDWKVAWVEKDLSIYPAAFLEWNVSLGRVLFVETGDYLWTALQILRSQIFKVLVLSVPVVGERVLRKFQIAAERSEVVLILLTESPTREGSWPISVQLQVRRIVSQDEPQCLVLKSRKSLSFEIDGEIHGKPLRRVSL